MSAGTRVDEIVEPIAEDAGILTVCLLAELHKAQEVFGRLLRLVHRSHRNPGHTLLGQSDSVMMKI